MSSWTFQVQLPCSPPTPNDRMHHLARADRNRRIRSTVEIIARSERNRLKPPPPAGPRDLAILWHRPGQRGRQPLDDDNAVAAMKAIRDAIAAAGWLLGNDDNAAAVASYAVRQAASPRGELVTVTISEP